jgi:hypothetical protein
MRMEILSLQTFANKQAFFFSLKRKKQNVIGFEEHTDQILKEENS